MNTSKVQYLDIDVLTAAKDRLRHTIATFDNVWIAFSGGKDSLATMLLAEEVYKEEGIKAPVNVFFRDEELIPDDVINFVDHMRQQTDRFNLKWFAIPLMSKKFILGKTTEYIQWDPTREWLRPKPDFSITEGPVLDQYTADTFIYEKLGMKGKAGFVTGIRADESLIRLSACLSKKHENYITATEDKRISLVKPIYDWSQKDVFRYFYDRKVKYCPIYDNQTWNRQGLRVSTPLHAESSKRFYQIRTLYPTFYQQLIALFPEMLVQERYWDEMDRATDVGNYEHSWKGIHQWIDDNLEDLHENEMAHHRVDICKRIRANKMKIGDPNKNLGGYPVLYVFNAIITGAFKRNIQPLKQPTQKMLEFEHVAI